MTSFQRLLRGLQVLNRYSGITGIGFDTSIRSPYQSQSTPFVTNYSGQSPHHRLTIPIPVHTNLDARDQASLTKLGWVQDASNWVFQP